MAGTLRRISGPAFIAASVADIYTPPAAAIFTVIKQIQISNHTGAAATFTLYIGATGGSVAGTNILGLNVSVPANSTAPYYFSPGLRMANTDFLTGVASAGSTLVITVMGEQNVV